MSKNLKQQVDNNEEGQLSKIMYIKKIIPSSILLLTITIHTQKVVLITGVSQGIGLAIAQKLAHNGYQVYGTVRVTSDTRQLQKAVNACKGNLIPLIMDVTDEASIAAGVQKILTEAGHIDVLINNACEVIIGTCETCTLEEQKRIMDVNYFGAVRMLQAVVPIMRNQHSGHVIIMSSVAGFEPFPIIESYVASKFALEGLSESLAIYLQQWGIAVSIIEPAGVKTNVAFTAHQGSRWNEDTRCYAQFCTAGHRAMQACYDECQNPEEIADLILTLLQIKQPSLRHQTNVLSYNMSQKRLTCSRYNRRYVVN